MFRIKQTEDRLTIYEIPVFDWLFWGFMILLGGTSLFIFRVTSLLSLIASLICLGLGIVSFVKAPLSIIEFNKNSQIIYARYYYIWGIRNEKLAFSELKSIRIEQLITYVATMYRLDIELSNNKHFPITKSFNSSLEDHKHIVSAIYSFLGREIPPFARAN